MTYTNLARTSDLPSQKKNRDFSSDPIYSAKQEIAEEFLEKLSGLSLSVMTDDLHQERFDLQDRLGYMTKRDFATNVKIKAHAYLHTPKIDAMSAVINLKKKLESAKGAEKDKILMRFRRTSEYKLVVNEIFSLDAYV